MLTKFMSKHGHLKRFDLIIHRMHAEDSKYERNDGNRKALWIIKKK